MRENLPLAKDGKLLCRSHDEPVYEEFSLSEEYDKHGGVWTVQLEFACGVRLALRMTRAEIQEVPREEFRRIADALGNELSAGMYVIERWDRSVDSDRD